MAKVVDITGRIRTEEVFIVVDGQEYKIDTSKNAMMEAMALVQADEEHGMDKALDKLLGKKAAAELTAGISWAGYQALFVSVMAEVTQVPYEEAEARFRGQK
jgi:xanthine/uracil permease